MDSKAEENLTKAREYESEVDVAVEKMESSKSYLGSVDKRIAQLTRIIKAIDKRYIEIYNSRNIQNSCNMESLTMFFIVGSLLKQTIDIPILDENKSLHKEFDSKVSMLKENQDVKNLKLLEGIN